MKQIIRLVFLLGIVLLATAPLAQNTSKPLNGIALENVMAFARILAYVRYFYPSDAAAQTNWDQFALAKIESVEAATNPVELAQQLEALFKPYAPSISVFAKTQTPPRFETPIAPRNGTVTFWIHEPVRDFANPDSVNNPWVLPSRRASVETLPNGTVPSKYYYLGRSGVRVPVEITIPSPDLPLLLPLNSSLSLRLPIALYTESGRTLPKIATPPSIQADYFVNAETRASRLAVLALAWGYFQHFYSYWDSVKTDWSGELKRGLEAVAVATPEEFDRQMQLLIAQLHDGHAYTLTTSRLQNRNCQLPITTDVVEGRLLVTTSNTPEVKVGDEIKTWDGQPALELVRQTEALISGSNQWKRSTATYRIALGSCTGTKSTVSLELEQSRKVQIKRQRVSNMDAFFLREARPPVLSDLGSGAMYLDLIRVSDSDFDQVLLHLQKAQHLVLDMRGYPNDFAMRLLGHLSNQTLRTAPFWIPMVTRPDGRELQFGDVRGTWSTPQSPQLTKSLAFVINANSTISYAESIMGIIEGYNIGFRVGSATAGTNGDIAMIGLPDGYRVVWTGLHVTKFDGSPLMNVGILPTHPAERTVAGVRAGRDELLEAAFTLLTKQNPSAMQPRAISLR